MVFNIRETDVMIVGADLSGLMMACQLLHFGIQPIIIDSRSSPSGNTQAIALQARSMEIFRQMGMVDEIIANGFECKGVVFQNRKNGYLGTDYLNNPNTPIPCVTIIARDQIEQIFINQLTLHACPVYWDTTLIHQKQDYQGIGAALNNEGNTVLCRVQWMIGADGIRSKVRELNGLSFDGKTYKQRFFLADVKLKRDHDDYLHLFLSPTKFFSVFSLPYKGQYQLGSYLPENTPDLVDYSDLKSIVDRIVGSHIPIKNCSHIECYSIHSKIASRFGDQRCFLIGDAAHVHSPLCGQGINIAMQDAYNLGWKLAFVVKGKQGASILHSYEAERRRLATSTLKKADRIFGMIINPSRIFRRIKNLFINKAINLILDNQKGKDFISRWFSQIDIQYRESLLSVHHSTSKKIKAGDRLPYLPVFDERTKTETDLHRWCEKPGFALILMGNINSHQLLILAKWLRQKYTHYMHIYYLPFSDQNRCVFEAFELKKEAYKMVLVRPDMHIAYIQDIISANLIDNYMMEVMKWKL